jgi:hypothetical protein
MNSTTTDQASVVLQRWLNTLTRYVAAAGVVLVLYDCLLTLQDEARLEFFWRLKAASVYSLLADTPCLARNPEFPKSLVLH